MSRWIAAVAAAWLGVMASIAFIAAPAAFAVLERPTAGQLVARLFRVEAPLALFLGCLVVVLARWEMRRQGTAPGPDAGILLPLGAVFCTVVGYYALQPLMELARQGQGGWTFGQLHAVSLGLYGLKMLLVAGLVYRQLR